MKTLLIAVLLVLATACAPVQTAPPPAAAPTQPPAAAATTAPPAAATTAPAAPTTAPAAATTAPGAAGEVVLNVTCRCVSGGVNAQQVDWMKQVFAKFEADMQAKGTPVKVNLVEFGGSDEQLKQQYALDLGVKQGADVMSFDGFWVPEFVASGLLKPLNEIAGPEVDSWEGWSHIPKSVQALLTFNDKIYGIPTGTDARAIWFRKDLFEKAGLPADWQPKSWDDVLDAARAIKKAMPDVTPIQLNAGTAMGEATTLQGWYMALLGTGSNVYDFDTSKYVLNKDHLLDTLNLYKTIYIDEKLGDARLQLLPDGRQQSFLNFRDGKIAMLVEGDFFWRSVLAAGDTKLEDRDKLVTFAKMPAMKPGSGIRGQDFVTASGGSGFTINPNTAHPKEAWELLAYMNSKESLDAFQAIQPRIRARDDVPVPDDPVMTAIATELLPLTTVRPADPNYPKVSEAIQLMTEQVVSGEMTPEQAADTYIKTVTDLVGADKVESAAP